jgi:pyridoxine 4-dehydrogenase
MGISHRKLPRIRPTRLHPHADQTFMRLLLVQIELYQLHIPDPAVSFDASMETLAKLREQGKILYIGLSNVTKEHVERARRIVPIVSVQNRYSFSDREWDFLVDYCEQHGIAFLPGSPLAQNRRAHEAVQKISAARGVSTAVVSLAWLLRRSPMMLPIPGTSSVEHLEENVSAAAFNLSDSEFEDLASFVAAPYSLR